MRRTGPPVLAALDRGGRWIESLGRADVAVGLAVAGVLMLGLASRWPVQALTGYRLENLHRSGPVLTALGAGLVTFAVGVDVVAADGSPPGRSAPARALGPARRAVRGLGLGAVPRPRARTLLVDPWLLAVGCVLLVEVAKALLPDATQSAVPPGLDTRYAAASAAGPLGTIGFCVFGAGLAEELLFRGPVVLAAHLGAGRRVLLPLVALSGLLFALFHLSRGPLNVLSTGLWGLLLAGYAARRRSLWPVVLAHALFDVYAFGKAGYVW